MNRPESDSQRRERLVAALQFLTPLCDAEGQAVINAELSPAEREGRLSAAAVTTPIVLPGGVAAYVDDPAALLDWAARRSSGEPHPLVGARLANATGERLAREGEIPGVSFRVRAAAVLVQVPAGRAIANRAKVVPPAAGGGE